MLPHKRNEERGKSENCVWIPSLPFSSLAPLNKLSWLFEPQGSCVQKEEVTKYILQNSVNYSYAGFPYTIFFCDYSVNTIMVSFSIK